MDRRPPDARRRRKEKDARARKRRREKPAQAFLPSRSHERKRRKRASVELTLRLRPPMPVMLRLSTDLSTVKKRISQRETDYLAKYCEKLNFPWLNANTMMHTAILRGHPCDEAWAAARIYDRTSCQKLVVPAMVPKVKDLRSLCDLMHRHLSEAKAKFVGGDTEVLEKLYGTKLARSCLRLLMELAKSSKLTDETDLVLQSINIFIWMELASAPSKAPSKCANLMVHELAKRSVLVKVYKLLVQGYGSRLESLDSEMRWCVNTVMATVFIHHRISLPFLKNRSGVPTTVSTYHSGICGETFDLDRAMSTTNALFGAFVVDIARFPAKNKDSWLKPYIPTVLNAILRLRAKLDSASHQAIMDVVLRELGDAAADVKKYVNSAEIQSLVNHKVDVLFAALCTDNIQQDLLRCKKKRGIFCGHVERLYNSLTPMFHGRPVLCPERQAEKTFGWPAQELDYDPYAVCGAHERTVARALGFCFQLTGYLDFNVLHAIASSKSESNIGRVFKWLFRLQRCARRTIQLENGKHMEIITRDEANAFSIQLERVRAEVIRLKTVENPPKKPVAAKNGPRIMFPPITTSKDFAKVISSKRKVEHFDNDPNVLSFLSKKLKDNAHELLSRFCNSCVLPFNWSFLERNHYVEPAKPKPGHEASGMCRCLSKAGEHKCNDGSCENVAMKSECSVKCGEDCANRRLQRGVTAKVRVINAGEIGLGLVPTKDLKKGDLVGEYCGEVINEAEFRRRVQLYQEEVHSYFMALSQDLKIDASRRSGITRYINHSCEPNCESQKWNTGGEDRIAIIANRDIKAGEELTFDYAARVLSLNDKPCLCGSDECRKKLATRDERLTGIVREGAGSRNSNRREKKVALGHRHLRTARKLAKEAKEAHAKRKEMEVDEKAVEEWKEKQKIGRQSFRIPRKVSKFQPAAPRAGNKKEEIVASGRAGVRPTIGWQSRKRQWGFENATDTTAKKAKTDKPERAPRKNVFQPHERADEIRRRREREQRRVAERLGIRVQKRKTDEERRIDEYDSANSDYSEISDGVPEPEDSWEYDVPELYLLNPYALNGGTYGEASGRIDAGKFSNVYAERKFDAHSRR